MDNLRDKFQEMDKVYMLLIFYSVWWQIYSTRKTLCKLNTTYKDMVKKSSQLEKIDFLSFYQVPLSCHIFSKCCSPHATSIAWLSGTRKFPLKIYFSACELFRLWLPFFLCCDCISYVVTQIVSHCLIFFLTRRTCF